MDKNERVMIHVRIDKSQHRKLRIKALQDGMYMGDIVRFALKEYFKKKK